MSSAPFFEGGTATPRSLKGREARVSLKQIVKSALRSPAVKSVAQRTQVAAPALLAAIGFYESGGGHLDAVGDDGISVGLFQINKKVWGVSDALIGAPLEVQLREATRVLADANKYVGDALMARMEKQKLSPPTVQMTVAWYSIVWQYGGPAFIDWIYNWPDHSAAGWAEYRTQTGNVVWPDHEKRQAQIWRDYKKAKRFIPAKGESPDFQLTWGEKLGRAAGKAGKTLAWGGAGVGVLLLLGVVLVDKIKK